LRSKLKKAVTVLTEVATHLRVYIPKVKQMWQHLFAVAANSWVVLINTYS